VRRSGAALAMSRDGAPAAAESPGRVTAKRRDRRAAGRRDRPAKGHRHGSGRRRAEGQSRSGRRGLPARPPPSLARPAAAALRAGGPVFQAPALPRHIAGKTRGTFPACRRRPRARHGPPVRGRFRRADPDFPVLPRLGRLVPGIGHVAAGGAFPMALGEIHPGAAPAAGRDMSRARGRHGA
jgi:hypothetical protein